MKINDLELPEAFVKGFKRKQFRREAGFWRLREELDAYGNHLETEIGDIYETASEIQNETDSLPKYFPRNEEVAEWRTKEFGAEPGFIPYITDFFPKQFVSA